MSGGALIAVGVVVLVVLAIVLLVGASPRRDTGGAIGELSRETRRRDRGRAGGGTTAPGEPVPSGRDVEKSAAIERREPSTAVVRATPGEVQPWAPPDPETLGVSRR